METLFEEQEKGSRLKIRQIELGREVYTEAQISVVMAEDFIMDIYCRGVKTKTKEEGLEKLARRIKKSYGGLCKSQAIQAIKKLSKELKNVRTKVFSTSC